MNITKDMLKTLWYEDKDGNYIGEPNDKNGWDTPSNTVYQVSQFPCMLTTNHLEIIRQEDVDKCKHPRKYIVPTYGWIDGIVGRECKSCHGTQTKQSGFFRFWPKKWEGHGSRTIFSANSGWNDDLVLVMAKSGDYTLSEAIILSARSCERCMNSLAFKYGLDWGYEKGSEEWEKSNTCCKFCEEEEVK